MAWWIGFKIDDNETWERVKNGTYKMFSIEGKANRIPVEKSAKTFDEILKFNPFHDAAGKFSSSQAMRTYSANPKTRAGAMAISRSAPNHGYVMNVHRESKGENIEQNYRWLQTGQKPAVPAAQAAGQAKPQEAPKNPAKPQNTQPQTTQQGGSESLQEAVKDVQLTNSQKSALQARNWNGDAVATKKLADDNYQERVDGKDISGSFDYRKQGKGEMSPIDAVAKAQGWDQNPTVTNDRELFDKACMQSGRVMVRTVHDNHINGQSGDDVAKETMTNGKTPFGAGGGQLFGSGMYVVDCSLPTDGSIAKRVKSAQSESFCYGDKQMMMTVHPNAKIASREEGNRLTMEFYNLPDSVQAKKFGNDSNAYIASKGYDGVKWHADSDPTAYTTVFNKSALICFGGVASSN